MLLTINKDGSKIAITVFLIAICCPPGDKWQSKALFLTTFDLLSSIVMVFDCHLSRVVLDILNHRLFKDYTVVSARIICSFIVNLRDQAFWESQYLCCMMTCTLKVLLILYFQEDS